MELIRPFERLGRGDAGIAGGKGASLGEMTQAGIPVPPGFVILADAFEQFLIEADLVQELEAVLRSVNQQEMHTVEHASEKIQRLILAARIPEDISDTVQAEFKKLNAEFVAVRSSATAEDSSSAAWAGQLDTYLNTTETDLLENVQRCWASLFTPRAIFYRFEKGMHDSKISVAVVVQKMVQSEVSGIAFSVHPVTEDYNQLIIEAGFGLGEAIVSGQVTPDSFVIEKEPRRIIDKNITYQRRALWRAESGGNEWRELSQSEGEKPALSDEQSLELAELILKIEKHYGFPCDIEWAYEAGHFYITQSRPITTLQAKTQPEEISVPLAEEINAADFVLGFEVKDQPLLFAELLAEYYFPDGGVHIFEGNTLLSYIRKDSVSRCTDAGAAFFADVANIKKVSRDLAALAKEFDSLKQRWNQATAVSQEDVQAILDAAVKFHQLYSHYYTAFMEGVYLLPPASQVEILQILDREKNEFRAMYNELFFATDGFFGAFLSKIATQYGLNVISDIRFYRMQEIEDLVRSGTILEHDIIAYRRIATVLSRFDDRLTFLHGDEAVEFSRKFLDGSLPKDEEVTGIIANSGRARGPVKVINADYQNFELMRSAIAEMQKGDVLVSVTTSPELMEACNKASAIITDLGGLLSHAAIVSRELGIPCIVGTQYASKIFKDGDLVEVDAEKGIVRKL